VDPNIAPDGSSVVFRSERNGGGIYVTKMTGTSERLLAPDGRNPRFSPDGGSVVYWVGDPDETVGSGKLFLLSVADGSSMRLAADFIDARLPVWSSDGQYILFTGCRTGDQPLPACSEWWVTSRDGTKVQNTGSLALLRGHQIRPIDEIGGWYRDTVLFSGRRGTTTSLWELALPRTSLKGEGKPRQLTSGDAREVAPSLADNDTIAFEHLTGALHIWRIAHASNPKLVTVTKLTQDAAVDLSPSISHDGRWLVFSRGIGSPHDIWIKNMQSGGESLFLASPQDKLSPIIDNSGTVVFEGRDSGVPSVFTAASGQLPRRLCTACSNPTGWFSEDRAVLYREGLPSKIKMVDLMTGEARIVLEANGYSLSDATWSPETQYLLFTASQGGNRKQVFAVLFPKSAQSPVGEWIPITGESEFSDRPRWSSDGKTVFYLSSRDSFSCVWGQHFDSESRKSTTPPFAVMHYHNPRFSPDVVVNRSFNLSVSGDSVYLNVGEINTSIWTGVLKRRGLFSLWNWRNWPR
jgi:Tol biopolymer transport system component